ncbi:MAG: hypothetical protein OEL20_17930 [Sulfuritalea sp.]|nr:hypothetical protein [Sulfuritalea sp.]
MSSLEAILGEVAKRGHSEVLELTLIPAYFRGDDAIEQLQGWARDNGLRITFNPSLFVVCRAGSRVVRFYK